MFEFYLAALSQEKMKGILLVSQLTRNSYLMIILIFFFKAIYQQLMYQSEEQASHDLLHLKTEPKFQGLLQSKERLILSTNIYKYNSEGKCQERILVITNIAILNILKSENIIRSFMKKFINFQNKYEIKRRIPLSNLYGITISPDRLSNVFLIHVNNEHDYHYRASNNKMLLIKVISEEYKKVAKSALSFYFKQESQICNYITTKSHVKQKKDIKPKDTPSYLNQDYFLDKKFGNELYACEYSHKNQNVQPKNFEKVQLKDIKIGNLYFILKQEFNRSIHVQNLSQSEMLLNPYYSFYSEKKQLLFIPFMIGGNLINFLAKFIPISKSDLIFYVSQIIRFLAELHASGKVYCNVTLQNILVKENGYLIFNGLQKSMQESPEQKLLFRVFGNPHYFSPEIIECRGYRQEIDVWKLGICAYILCKGQFPFQGKNIKELYFNILNKSIEGQEDIPNFVKRMLEKDKEKRIKIGQLLKLEYFSKQNIQKISKQTEKAPFLPDISTWKSNIPIIYRLDHKEGEN